MTYGIANRTGQPSQERATEIVKVAWENGVEEFDTAQGYGESERVLGRSLFRLNLLQKAKVTTKLHPSLDHLDPVVIKYSIENSLKTIGVPSLYCIMLHNEELLSLWHKGLRQIMAKFVAKGIVQKIGVSVYSPEKAVEAVNMDDIDIIQVPTNVLDRRFERAGLFETADSRGKEVYIRSIFLQGLILMRPGQLPQGMLFAVPVLEEMADLSEMTGLTRQEIAVAFVKNGMQGAKVVFGAETKHQVMENLAAWRKEYPPSLLQRMREAFPDVGEQVLNPHLWQCERSG